MSSSEPEHKGAASSNASAHECTNDMHVHLSRCEAGGRDVQMGATQDDSEAFCPLPYCLRGGTRGAGLSPREGSGRRAGLSRGALLAEGRQGREAGHSSRLAGKYLEGCFPLYKHSACLFGSVCRGWEGRAGPRPAKKPV